MLSLRSGGVFSDYAEYTGQPRACCLYFHAATRAYRFVVPNVDPGSYVVEIVDTAGRIVGTSAIATVVVGSIASVAVTAASTELVGGMSGTAIAIIVAASAAAVIGIVVATTGDESSPSQ